MSRKVCVVIQSRANYARIKSLLRACANHPALELQIIVGASALLERFGDVRPSIEADGFSINGSIHSMVEGGTPETMVKSTGLGMIELSSQFDSLRPDVVVTVADRFETLATAVAASYMNIPLAHTQGGEFTGSIDESVRHAITKLAHVHFPATSAARSVILRMGENPDAVFLTGCPSIDLASKQTGRTLPDLLNSSGVGDEIDVTQDYVLVMQHPVTTEFVSASHQVRVLLKSVERLRLEGMQVVWMWPNIDAGADAISKTLREYREDNSRKGVHFYRNFSPEDFLTVMRGCAVMLGNSSSAIREGSFLGVPAVNIGTRQQNRERGPNVIDVGYDADSIYRAARVHLDRRKPVPKSKLYGDGTAGIKIAAHLAEQDVGIDKIFHFNEGS